MAGMLSRIADSLVSAVSARAAARRAHFRRMQSDPEYATTIFALMSARGYKAARSGRNDGDWLGGGASGDADLSPDLDSMRNRSRELDRDDSIGSGIFNLMEQMIVGRELRPQARTGDRDKNRRLEAVWNERKHRLFPAEAVPLGAVQRRICRRKLADGDIFVKPSRATQGDPVWFELVEGDRVATPVELAGKVQDGIAKDEHGRPETVYVRRAGARIAIGMNQFLPVPISAIYHSKRGTRGGLTRGEPLLHAIMQDIRDLDILLLAAMKRTQVACCIAAFLKSPDPIDDILESTAQKYHYRLDATIEPGMIFKLFPGEEMQSFIPSFPIPELVPFVIVLACRIAAATGLTWQYILKDFSKDTYSSARTSQLACEPSWDTERDDEVNSIWTPVWIEVMTDAALRGDPRLDGITAEDIGYVSWQGDGRKWVDPEAQAKAKQIARQLGIETYAQQCAEIGTDPEDNLDAIQELLEECARRQFPDWAASILVFGVPPKPIVASEQGEPR